MKEVTLKETHELLTTILRDFDKICRENNIEYWIESGTALGAVRHGGFIPWDDDIDIAMRRDEYERFIKIAEEKLPEDLFLLYPGSSEEVFFHGWAKIKHKHSRIVELESFGCPEGIYIDIFPYDFHNESDKSKIVDYKKKYMSTRARIYESGLGLEQFKSKDTFNKLKIIFSKGYNGLVLRKDLKEFYQDIANSVDRTRGLHNSDLLVQGREVFEFSDFIPKEAIFPLKEIDFNGVKVKAPNNLHKYLTVLYGNDYMTLPPKEKRQFHNFGLYIDKHRK